MKINFGNFLFDILTGWLYFFNSGKIMSYSIIAIVLITIFYIFNPKKRPLPTESDLSNKIFPLFHLYYASKYLNPVKRAEKGSDLEKYFRENKAPQLREKLKDSKEILINAVGDIMIRTEISRGNFSALWEEIGPHLFNSEITFGNMEFAVNENWKIDKTIRFSMAHSQADVMLGDERFGHFDIVSLANNHINDSLSEGIRTTGEYLDSKGILHVGANPTEEDRDSFPIIEKEGIKTAFLSYTFSTNGVPLEPDFHHGTNLIRFNALNSSEYDPSLIERHIGLAKERGADLIIASLHWGVEFEYYPPTRIVERGHQLLEKGIDIIIGHHPHILNPSEWYRTKDGRDTVCFYSLNGVTSQTLPTVPQNMGLIAGIRIEKGFDCENRVITRIKDIEMTPTFFLRSGTGIKSSHRILPLLDTIKKINRGKEAPYISLFQKMRLRYADREFRKYFKQDSFRYK